VHGPLANINAGDSVLGQICVTGTCQTNGSSCHWTIAYTINGAGFTGLGVQPPDIYNTAQIGVLEVYGVSNCNQMPASGASVFSIDTFYQAGNPWTGWVSVTPSLSGIVVPGLNPSCSYQAIPLANGTTLDY
jgi:hypothetical protein